VVVKVPKPAKRTLTNRIKLVLVASDIIRQTHNCHNHPSGSPTPTIDDSDLTRRLAATGDVLGVPLVVHGSAPASGADRR
jgi:RadC-like JAB domain-containing protein